MIEINNLEVWYGSALVAHVPDLVLAPGTVTGIAGESGSGKSQTALAILGLNRMSGARITGSVQLSGMELTSLSPRQMRRVRGSRIAMIMQSPRASLNPTLTLGALFRRTLHLHGVNRTNAEERMNSALTEVVLEPDILNRYPHQVSGGQAQRFAIALAVALHAEVLIADEPTSALDVTVQAEVVETLRRLRDTHGTTLLLISHDLAVMSELAEQLVIMRKGRVVEKGTASTVLTAPADPYTWELLDAVPRINRGEQ